MKAIVLVCSLAVAVLVAQDEKKEPQWKDRGEYDIYEAITKEANPVKKLELLSTWKEKYPQSDYAGTRTALFLNTYVAAKNFPKVVETAKEILAANPLDLTSHYYITSLAVAMNNTGPDVIKSATMLADDIDKMRPPGAKDEDWAKAKHDMGLLGLRTLGWAQMQRKENPQAEATLKRLLEKNPKDAEVSYWLYTIIRGGKDPTRNSEAFWHLARAASLTGDGALPEENRKKIDDFFVKAYYSYHGKNEDDLKHLREQAEASTHPPPGFKIETEAEIVAKQENELKRDYPQYAFWLFAVKKPLNADGGEEYFASTVKGFALPGKIEAPDGTTYTKLKGKVVSHKPAVNPKEIVIGMDTRQAQPGQEVTLKLDAPLRGRAEPGTEIQFEGVPSEFTRDPFMLTFDVERDNVEGWPVSSGPPLKKTGGASKGKKKK